MPSMIALTEVEDLVPGQVLPIDRYLVEPRELARLGHSGAFYLVAEPENALFLVAALEEPERSRLERAARRLVRGDERVPVTEISKLRRMLALGEPPRR